MRVLLQHGDEVTALSARERRVRELVNESLHATAVGGAPDFIGDRPGECVTMSYDYEAALKWLAEKLLAEIAALTQSYNRAIRAAGKGKP